MLVIGAKGFAKEVLEILHQNGETDGLTFYDDVNMDIGESLFGFPIIKNTAAAQNYFEKTDQRFTIGIGNPKLRKQLADKFIALGGALTSVVSKNAEIGSFGIELKEGCIIMGGVRISNDVKIQRGTIIYYNTSITHDVEIEEFVEISPNSCLLGRCKIGSETHIAAHSVIFPDVSVGKNSIIAAGSVVRASIPDNVMVAGIPAVIKKELI